MKNRFCTSLLLCLICLLAASCSKNAAAQNSAQTNDNITATEKADIDLTLLSSTVVYAEVYNMMINPDDYVGKSIKGSGVYDCFYYEELDRYFHYLIVSDATGCCPQGLDFVWECEHTYPDGYPKIGETIELTGVFVKGEIEGQPYYYLAIDADGLKQPLKTKTTASAHSRTPA